MKRALAGLFAVATAMGVAACGGASNAQERFNDAYEAVTALPEFNLLSESDVQKMFDASCDAMRDAKDLGLTARETLLATAAALSTTSDISTDSQLVQVTAAVSSTCPELQGWLDGE